MILGSMLIYKAVKSELNDIQQVVDEHLSAGETLLYIRQDGVLIFESILEISCPDYDEK